MSFEAAQLAKRGLTQVGRKMVPTNTGKRFHDAGSIEARVLWEFKGGTQAMAGSRVIKQLKKDIELFQKYQGTEKPIAINWVFEHGRKAISKRLRDEIEAAELIGIKFLFNGG